MSKIQGRLIEGQGLGRKLGFPSLNIEYNGDLEGVFCGRILLEGKWENAAVHLGPRPTVGGVKPICEVHVLNWNKSLKPGIELEVEVLGRIRDVQKFESVEALKKQIAKDVEYVKMTLC